MSKRCTGFCFASDQALRVLSAWPSGMCLHVVCSFLTPTPLLTPLRQTPHAFFLSTPSPLVTDKEGVTALCESGEESKA